MVKQHLDELDQQIQEMLAFRQDLASRYEQIEASLADASAALTETHCNGIVCGLIERSIETSDIGEHNETQNNSNC
jgi:hypothetical protein